MASDRGRERWRETTRNRSLKGRGERRERFVTTSDIEIADLYTAADTAELVPDEALGYPGEYPYTRGVQPTMYRGRLWTMRQYAGFGSAEHREVAREAVRKSLVLLKNENEALPLDRTARILVAGKNAHNRGHQCGGFTVAWQGVTDNESIEGGMSIFEGIRVNNSRLV